MAPLLDHERVLQRLTPAPEQHDIASKPYSSGRGSAGGEHFEYQKAGAIQQKRQQHHCHTFQ
ncbi:hypothetical protein MJ581_25680 [Escherichia coli]|nr:hypothetical protein MJ581_25680 [Escherichia coli]